MGSCCSKQCRSRHACCLFPCGIFNYWCCCCGGCGLSGLSGANESNTKSIDSMLVDCQQWHTGDIVLKTSTEFGCIPALGNSEWTHVCFVVRNGEGGVYVEDTLSPAAKGKVYLFHAHSNFAEGRGLKIVAIEEARKRMRYDDDGKDYFGYRKFEGKKDKRFYTRINECIEEFKGRKFNVLPFSIPECGGFNAGCQCCCCCWPKVTSDSRMQQVFCSELMAHVMQETGIMAKMVSAHAVQPGWFDEGRFGVWAPAGEDPYARVQYYKGGTTETEVDLYITEI